MQSEGFPELHGEAPNYPVVLALGLAQRQPRIDLQRLPGSMTAVGLDQRVVEPLLLEPGQQKMPQLVRRQAAVDACQSRVPLEHPPHAPSKYDRELA